MSKCTFQKDEQNAVLSVDSALALKMWFTASASPRNLLEGQILASYPRPTESKLSRAEAMMLLCTIV